MTEEEKAKRRGRKPAEETQKDFPRLLKDLAQARGVTQAELSQSLAVTSAYVSQLATGLKTPRPETVDRLATAMNLDPVARRDLHVAAAKDTGFRLDLPDDF